MTTGPVIDVRLRATWVASVGYRYDVILDGKTIVSRSRDPEYEAARVLHSLGVRGRFRTIDFGTGRPRMILDIEEAARLRTIERDAGGPPTLAFYRPMSSEEKARARVHRSDQGRLVAEGAANAADVPLRRSGGKRGVALRRLLPMSNPERRTIASRRRRNGHRKEA